MEAEFFQNVFLQFVETVSLSASGRWGKGADGSASVSQHDFKKFVLAAMPLRELE